MSPPVELLFRIEREDDWPPAAVEGIWVEPVGGAFRALTCPLFVGGLSVGDLFEPDLADDGEVVSFRLIRPSQHSTVWVLADDPEPRESLRTALEAIGCDTVGLSGLIPALIAIDVPPSVALDAVDALLDRPARDGHISVAYPSLRHPDS